METGALLQADNALAFKSSVPKAKIVLHEDNVVGLSKLLWRQGGLWHATHEWILVGKCTRLLPIVVPDRTCQIPWETLCDAFGPSKHLLEPGTLPVAGQASIHFLERSLENRCLANRFVILIAEGAQEVDLAVGIVVVTAVADDVYEARGIRFSVRALDIP